MRHKSTVYSPEFHEQFKKSKEQVLLETEKKSGVSQKEQKEGQSKYRIGKAIQKQSI